MAQSWTKDSQITKKTLDLVDLVKTMEYRQVVIELWFYHHYKCLSVILFCHVSQKPKLILLRQGGLKNGSSIICEIQALKKLKWYDLF